MEEVWKDINLASLNDHNTRPSTTHSTFGGAIFQDFLGQPFPPNTTVSSSSLTASPQSTSLYSPAPPLVTALSLNSRPDFPFDPLRPNPISQLPQPLHHHHHHHHHPPSKPSSPCFPINPPPPFDNHHPCTSPLPYFGSNKRFAEPADYGLGDRRNKRMIKNRESAARSRARKQAYTNELKHKVDHLLEENARLKRQQQELWEAAAGQQKKKSNLYRSATAPF